MSTSSIGAGASLGRLSGAAASVRQAHAGQGAQAASASMAVLQPGLSQIQWGSTWPRGWMAAAVPQYVREFNVQVSKAQMALAFLDAWSQSLQALEKAVKRQHQLPSAAGKTRAMQALTTARSVWLQRYADTAGSLDECLEWSPTQLARKVFSFAGWSVKTLQAQSVNDRELVSWSLLGQEHAHGAWMALHGRSTAASRHALAAALAPLRIQLQRSDALQFSVDERMWPVLQERMVMKGNGQRVPAGQWVAAPLQLHARSIQPQHWSVEDPATLASFAQHVKAIQDRVADTRQKVMQFYQSAGHSLDTASAQRMAQMQQFADAFAAAGQAPAYDWVLAVVPAVRAISRQRVARLLKASPLAMHMTQL